MRGGLLGIEGLDRAEIDAILSPRSPSNMGIENCPNCGGTHIGSNKCPFISAPCVVCGEATILACSDCAIDSGGKNSVHICDKPSCRNTHERQHTNAK